MLIVIDLHALPLTEDIVVCQAHPALVKIGLVLACLFHFNSLSGLVHLCTD